MPSSPLNAPASEHHQSRPFPTNRSTSAQEQISARQRAGRVDHPKHDVQSKQVYDANTRIYPREITRPSSTVLTSESQQPRSPTSLPVRNPNAPPYPYTLGSSPDNASQYTREWARSLQTAALSPPRNGLNIAGSPPGRFPLRVTQDGRLSRTPPLQSAPLHTPPSHDSGRRVAMGGFPPASVGQQPIRQRRSSMMSDGSRVPFNLSPPLPHQPQPHFFGAPEIDFAPSQKAKEGMRPRQNGYYCGFDTLRTCGDNKSASANNILIMGFEGGLEVLRIEEDKLDVIGRIDNLMGGVVEAKIIPCSLQHDALSGSTPLVALVVHGPVIEETDEDRNSDGSDSMVEANSKAPSASSCDSRPSSRQGVHTAEITAYQTSVQVYSLRTGSHIATLFKCPPTPLSDGDRPPQPAGNLTIAANGKFVVIASGCSGEVFLFAPSPEDVEGFKCIGKVWTSIQSHPRRPVSGSLSGTDSYNFGEADGCGRIPLFSLSNRWLAISPPAVSRLSSLNGTALTSGVHKKPAGLSTHSAPPQPSSNCITETLDGNSLFNRMAREVTKEIVKGARWVGDQGMQAFKAYWNRPVNGQAVSNGLVSDFAAQQAQYFPPTHAQNVGTASASDEGAVVSIYDLQKLLDTEDEKSRQAPTPMATFQPPLSFSFLSFSSSGLSLLTVSKKGDMYSLWDLMEVVYGRTVSAVSMPSAAGSLEVSCGRRVREVAAFTRITEATVVDATWTAPNSERLAVLTAKGTVHIYDIPESAFRWPPPRPPTLLGNNSAEHDQATTPAIDAAIAETPIIKSIGIGGSTLTSAVQAFSNRSAPLLSNLRESNGLRFQTLKNLSIAPTASAVGAKGGKAVAAGLELGRSAAAYGMNSIRNAGDNKIYLPSVNKEVVPGCIRWLAGREEPSLGVVAEGTVRIYKMKRERLYRNRSRGARSKASTQDARTVIAKGKTIEYTLPLIPANHIAPAAIEYLEAQTPAQRAKIQPTAFWTLKSPPLTGRTQTRAPTHSNPRPTGHAETGPAAHPLSFAEIDTNAAYQPFHADRRVSLFALSEDYCAGGMGPVGEEGQWAFGQDIPAVKIRSVPSPAESTALGEGNGDEPVRSTAADAGPERDRVSGMRGRERGQGVHIHAGEKDDGEDDDGFFEEDCEVLNDMAP